MRRLAFALSLSGLLLLATWVQAPAGPAREITAPSAAEVELAEQAAQAIAPVARQIDQDAERLRQHLAARVPFNEPARDPFRFKKATAPRAPGAPAAPGAPVVLNVPPPPPVAVPLLIGVTEDVSAGVVTRTAVLSMGDDMAIVKVGQPFARFVVQSIGATSVDLIDVTSPNRAVTTIAIR